MSISVTYSYVIHSVRRGGYENADDAISGRGRGEGAHREVREEIGDERVRVYSRLHAHGNDD